MPERDPDELLEQFARLTGDVVLPAVPRDRALPAFRAPAMLATLLLVAVGAALVVVYGPRLVPAGAPPTASFDAARTFVTEWRIDGAAPPSPDTRLLRVLATQEACDHKRASVGQMLRPEVTYTTDDIVITLTAVRGFNRERCDRVEEVVLPVLVELTEPVAGRRISDGQHQPARVRWQPRPGDAIALPAARRDAWPLGVPFVSGICPDVGLDAVLTGAPNDARLVWLVGSDGAEHERGLTWPPGFSVRFAGDEVQILNEANLVVRRGGDHVDGACAGGESLNLYAMGYSPLDEGAHVEETTIPSLALPPTPTPSPHELGHVEPWRIDAPMPVEPSTSSLRLLVDRTVCQDIAASTGEISVRHIVYAAEEVVVTMQATSTFDLAGCRFTSDVAVPVTVELSEPLNQRVLKDGSFNVPVTRWRPLAADALPLPTKHAAPYPLGVWVQQICADVGLEGVIAGSRDDPRLVWVEGETYSFSPSLWWPPGFSVRFADGVEVLNEAGEVVWHEGDRVYGACVVGSTGDLSLYGGGWSTPDN